MVGQIYPAYRHDTSEPVIALLIPVNTAMEEYVSWSDQEITRHDFIKELRDNGVSVFNNIDEFVKVRDNLKEMEKLIKKEKKKHKRNISEERRNQLKEHASSIRAKIGSSISQND